MAVTVNRKKRRLKEMLSDTDGVSKRELESAVVEKAASRAAKCSTDPRVEEGRLWNQIYTRPNYNGGISKYETPKVGSTQAEQKLHWLAVEVQKKEGLTYSQAYSAVLKRRPELYSQYVREVNTGSTFEAPEPAEYKASGFLSRCEEDEIRKRRAAKDDSGGSSLRLRGKPSDLDEDEDEDEDEDDDEDADNGDDDMRGGGASVLGKSI
jgi:hypothetical protein